MKKAFTFLPGLRPDRQDITSGKQAHHAFLDIARLTIAGDPSSALKRRREQLRKAQRTHRQRKDQYFKTLESQLFRLRASEVSLTLQVQELRNQVEALRLSPFCVPHDRSTISESDEHATVLDSWDTESRTHVSSQITSIENSSTRSSNPHNQETGFIDAHQLAPFLGPANPLNSSPVTHDKSRGLDMIGAGMEFVLAYVSLPTQSITLCSV
ncbi:uncharacterized protein N7518_006393 [Penicillium psychrosexuale]|uniref:uncharacterized protein n=1 Tax=Penicillium psychrosexuale TaxID=1002107 RepID=UPI0025454994|nr:uncharacterized protein N7518_006393 [Penicillium psychrosexuale]KAJ5789382.1 hypothetical protein N7518_006393 [Penicillium psychrosexuale]